MKPASLDIDPFGRPFLADPYGHHAALRDAGPVVWLEPLGVYAMARYDEVRLALLDHRQFCSGRGVGLSDFALETPWRPPSLLLEADPPLHDRTRRIMNRIVSLATLRDMRVSWQQAADRLIDALVARRRFDAVTDLAEAFPLAVFPDTIGVPVEGRENLIPYARTVFNAFGPRNDIFEAGNAEAGGAGLWVAEACRRENLHPDRWGAAVYRAADEGECSEEEAMRLVRSFLSAGVDTTVNGIGHMLLGLATHPEQWQLLRERPQLLRKVLDESLRWDSTVQTFFRTSTSDVEVAGVRIPEGAKILLFLSAANRDPRKWDDPEAFRIDRATSGHVGFGFGIHQCLGQMVARLEAEVVLEALLARATAIRLAGKPLRRLNNTLHALASLPMEIEPL